MTKQIIIDGVDVSKCDRYITNDGYIGIYKTPVFKGDCKLPHIGKCQGSECLFKRFKRKEQKLKKIKEIATCCSENMFCSDCKWDYMCGGELTCLILLIIEGEENGK